MILYCVRHFFLKACKEISGNELFQKCSPVMLLQNGDIACYHVVFTTSVTSYVLYSLVMYVQGWPVFLVG